MVLPVNTVLTAGTKLEIQTLLANRTLASFTVQSGAAVSAGATSVSLKVASGTLFLMEGTILDFGGATKTVTLAADITVGVTTALVAIKTPIVAPLTISDVAITNALLQVLGGNDASFKMSDNETSTRSFENGLFDDAIKVMVGGTVSWSGIYRVGDKSIDIIESCALSSKEIFVRLTYPDGKIRSGVAYVQGFSEGNALDKVRELSWTFRLVGEIKFTTPVG